MSKVEVYKCDICGAEHRAEPAYLRINFLQMNLDKAYSDICPSCKKDIEDLLKKLAAHD